MSVDSQNEQSQSQNIENNKLETLRNLLDQAERVLAQARILVSEETMSRRAELLKPVACVTQELSTDRVVEGVFDGCQMIGSDSRRYPVSPNYASKSKMVVGDTLKLTILVDGSFVFKQVGPVERKKLVGVLSEEHGRYIVTTENRHYQVLPASVTYHRANPGDRLTIVVPRDSASDWAAVENNLG